MIAYKIVRQISKDGFVSFIIEDANKIIYYRNKNQKVPNACCFRTKRQATEFAARQVFATSAYSDISIFKVEIKESTSSPTLCPVFNGSILGSSVLPKMVSEHPILRSAWPNGTIFASEIKLLEEIKELE